MITIFIQMKVKVFLTEILCFNSWLCPKFAYEVPNRIMQDQTKACITKWLCETTLFWDTTQWWVVILYWHFKTTCLSKLKGSRCAKQMTELHWHSVLFWDSGPSSNFFKEAQCFRNWPISHFHKKKHLTLWAP